MNWKTFSKGKLRNKTEGEVTDAEGDLYNFTQGMESAEVDTSGEDANSQEAETEVETEVESQDDTEVENSEEVEETKPASISFDDASLEKLGQLIASKQPRQEQQVQQQRQPTQEDIDRILKPVRVNAELLTSLGFDEASPEQIKGFQKFADMIADHAAARSHVMTESRARQFEGVIQPLQNYVQQVQLKQAEDSFYGSYPALNNYREIVAMVADRVSPTDASGRAKTVKQVQDEVATHTAVALKKFNINIDPKAASPKTGAAGGSGTGVPKPQQRQAPGRSGGGVGSQKTNNPDADIYQSDY